MPMTPSSLSLDGIRILDLSRVLAGPFCGMLLADLGADVVKVEDTGTGDESRTWPPHKDGESAAFAFTKGTVGTATAALVSGAANTTITAGNSAGRGSASATV